MVRSHEKNKLVKQAVLGTYIDTETGEEFKFQSKDFIPLMDEREDVREQIYKKICEETILQYKSDTLDIDSMEVDTQGAEKFKSMNTLLNMLKSAEADKAKALLSLELLVKKAVGIGDHSTEDFYKNVEEGFSTVGRCR